MTGYSVASIRLFVADGLRYTVVDNERDYSLEDWKEYKKNRVKKRQGRPVKHKCCTVCGGLHIAKGLCSKCYARKRREK